LVGGENRFFKKPDLSPAFFVVHHFVFYKIWKLWQNKFMIKKKGVVIAIQIIIAVLFVIGADWAGDTAKRLFHSYFADIFLPFGFYFLLILNEDIFKFLRKWYIKALIIFLLCATSETLQYFSIYALATVFDPVDYLMYSTGVLLASMIDNVFFKRVFVFWN